MPNLTDPRERLMSVGNELLDTLYKLDDSKDLLKNMTAVKDDKEALTELSRQPGAMDSMLGAMLLGFQRDSLLREYVTLRQTIEALTASKDAGIES